MDTRQFRLFQRITLEYFGKLAPGDPPIFGEPFLHFGDLGLDTYTSLVRIRGEYDGCIFLTSPREMLLELLRINGEPEVNGATLEDMSRELANVLAGNASQAFGGNWEISVPESVSHDAPWPGNPLPPSTFLMPIHWRGQQTLLGIGLALPSTHQSPHQG